MDATRLLGALLGGVLTPPRPRRTTAKRTTKPAAKRTATPAPLIDVRVGGSRRTASALAALARLAAEALAQTSAPSPRAPAPPAPAPRPTPPGVPVPYPVAGRPSPWGTAKPAAPPAPPAEPVGAEEREALLIIRAMIAAARADGALDAEERAAIAGQLDQAGLDDEARELVLKEFASPASLDALAREIADPVLAAQVYAACVIAVGQASDAERAWLGELARRTGLAAETVAAIERRLAAG
ncbi:DUF533 domain-containing protein [Elioraea tepidiphila]|jgi:uncharacterized membrane protein YebE (DUF533 family)|uniref:DUF533 domain-containing protein n=1 Tax=Elioraea tepidiphila TaxID=457934 RepID=UPI000360E480|nr:DUF533 domain-containing protein [Elioraea tepidiphila]